MLTIFVDFDSTIITTEALDLLASMICNSNTLIQIKELTDLGMSGSTSMEHSLSQRIQLLNANMHEISILTKSLFNFISPSIAHLQELMSNTNYTFYIISGGFEEYIFPIGEYIGFKKEHIFANKFEISNQKIVGFDTSRFLWQKNGKSLLINSLNIAKPKILVGDGYTDLEAKIHNQVDKYIAYTETVARKNIIQEADVVCQNFDEVKKYINNYNL